VLPVFSCPEVTIIHCGAESVTRGVFRRKAGRLSWDEVRTVALADSTGAGQGWVENVVRAIQSLGPAGDKNVPAMLVLPPHVTLLKHLQIPRVDERKRARLVGFAAAQNIPSPLSEVVWDSVLSGENESTHNLLLAAAKLEVVEPLCVAMKESGHAVRRIVPSCVAVFAACQAAGLPGAEPVLVLHVGPRSSVLLQMSARGWAVRTVQFGSQGPIAPAELAERLGAEITRSVYSFQGQNGLPEPVRILLTTPSATEPALAAALAKRLGIPVGGIDLAGGTAPGPAGQRCDGAVPGVELSGAARLQWGAPPPGPNLLPARLSTQQRRRLRRPWLAAATLCMLSAPVFPLVHFQRVAQSAQTKWREIEAAIAPWRMQEMQNRAKLSELVEWERQIVVWQDLHQRKAGWVRLMTDLQDRLSGVEDVWLEKIRVVPPTAGAPLKLALTGRMLDRGSPAAMSGSAALNRARVLLETLGLSPFVTSITSERFDGSQPGVLGFELVLVISATVPL
jgi:type IV pilus assembly protein PilM